MVEPTLGAAAAVRIGASVAGSVLSSGSSNNQKSNKRFVETLPESDFIECLSEVHLQPPRLTYDIEEKSAEIHEVPSSCMYHAHKYLQHPDAEYMNQNQGYMTVIGLNSLRMEDMPDPILHKEMLEKLGHSALEGGCDAQVI